MRRPELIIKELIIKELIDWTAIFWICARRPMSARPSPRRLPIRRSHAFYWPIDCPATNQRFSSHQSEIFFSFLFFLNMKNYLNFFFFLNFQQKSAKIAKKKAQNNGQKSVQNGWKMQKNASNNNKSASNVERPLSRIRRRIRWKEGGGGGRDSSWSPPCGAFHVTKSIRHRAPFSISFISTFIIHLSLYATFHYLLFNCIHFNYYYYYLLQFIKFKNPKII